MRMMGLGALAVERDSELLRELALKDSDSGVRTAALKKLKDFELAQKLARTDESYKVIGAALDIVNRKNPEEGLAIAQDLIKEYHKPLLGPIGDILASSKDPKYLDYFEKNIHDVTMFSFFNYMAQYSKLAKSAEPSRMVETSKVLKSMVMEESNTYFKKYSCANLIEGMIAELKKKPVDDKAATLALNALTNDMIQIVNSTSDTRLINAFERYLEKP